MVLERDTGSDPKTISMNNVMGSWIESGAKTLQEDYYCLIV